MHIEIQVALNFVISYLYNKLPRRRVNLFGEELEKALRDKFHGHWYPEKPFKGSAFRCLKTGDPVDAVLERAARESGVPIADILENLPAELCVWIDPREVSYRIGEKGAVKILYSENNERPEESSTSDREETKTFNPEAQCFRPIDAVTSSLAGFCLSPKTSPQGSPATSGSSPTFKVAGTAGTSPAPAKANGSFLPRSQAPLTFTTATFAQTKFGSTKLKTSSKRANSSYRMSPTEFSNYIKQRAMQQQLHHSHAQTTNGNLGHFGPIGAGPSSPSRSISPNPMAIGLPSDGFYFPNVGMGVYPQFSSAGPRNIFESHFNTDSVRSYQPDKFSSYLDPHSFYGLGGSQQPTVPSFSAINGNGGNLSNNGMTNNIQNASNSNASIGNNSGLIGNGNGAQITPSSPGANSKDSKLLEGLNSFYSNAAGPYQHLLVAN